MEKSNIKDTMIQLLGTVDLNENDACEKAAEEFVTLFDKCYLPYDPDSYESNRKVITSLYDETNNIAEYMIANKIDGQNLWLNILSVIKNNYNNEGFPILFLDLIIRAQLVRCFNEIAKWEYEVSAFTENDNSDIVVKCLSNMLTYYNLPYVYDINQNIDNLARNYIKKIIANTFSLLDMHLYNNSESHEIFIRFLERFSKSSNVINHCGKAVLENVLKMIKLLDNESPYLEKYCYFYAEISNRLKKGLVSVTS